MKFPGMLFVLGCALVAGIVGCEHSPSAPETADTFQGIEWIESGFDDAAKLADHQDKVLLVYAMAQWCGWCNKLSQVTWADSSVIEWVNRNAVPFRWDVDDPALRGLLPGVSAIPTVVILRSGEEVARKLGYAPAGEYLAWFESLTLGTLTQPSSHDLP